MPTRHPFPQAMKLAGDLYGKILDRNADKGGFDYVLDSLVNGRKSVRQHALEMVLSEEFENKFIKGRDAKSIVILLNRLLAGRDLALWQLKSQITEYERLGLEEYAEQLTQSSHYLDLYGDDSVPGNGHLRGRRGQSQPSRH